MYWLVLAALGDALTAILGCAGILAGVWFMARGSRAGADVSIASSAAPPSPAPVPVADPAQPPDPPAGTTFRHGAIRLVGEPATEAAPAPTLAAVPALEPESAPDAESAPEPEPEPAPEPAPPAYVPPPVPRGPRTSFRQGPIRLGGIEHGAGSRGSGGEPPDAA